MRLVRFFADFARVALSPDAFGRAEVRFVVRGVEVRVDRVRCEIGDPVVWTVALTDDPGPSGRVLTATEAEAAFRPRTIEEEAP